MEEYFLLCGGVFLGPSQQFSLCLDLAMSSHLHDAKETVLLCLSGKNKEEKDVT